MNGPKSRESKSRGSVELLVSGRDLADLDVFTKTDPMCVLFVRQFGQWKEHGRTEAIRSTLNPKTEELAIMSKGSAAEMTPPVGYGNTPPPVGNGNSPPPVHGNTPPPVYENTPPPVYGYTPPVGHAQQSATVSYVTSTMQVIHRRSGPGVFLGKYPCVVFCQNCGCHVTTRVEYISGRYTILLCLLILFFGCGLGCCLIPMYMNSCKDVLHHCPVCGQVIGFHRRF